MVILGGLEVLAAGYLLHKHNQNKRERAIIREETAALEEQTYPLQDKPPYSQPHRHSHSHDREETREERRERHRRRHSRERRERQKREWEDERRYGREHSAPPKINVPVKRQDAVVFPMQTQTQQPGGVVTGWPASWEQSHTAPTPPPQTQRQVPLNANEYPQDIKYGFDPSIPHDQYPSYPPPPFSPGPSDRRGRANTLNVNDGPRGRPKTRRSVSPRLGVYDEYDRSPTPQVRFSTENVVLGEERRESGRKRREGRERSPPPSYHA